MTVRERERERERERCMSYASYEASTADQISRQGKDKVVLFTVGIQ